MTRSPKSYHAPPVNPAERTCEFCEAQATESYPITEGKLYIYTCAAHFTKGVESVTGRRVDRPRRRKGQDERLFDVSTLPRVE